MISFFFIFDIFLYTFVIFVRFLVYFCLVAAPERRPMTRLWSHSELRLCAWARVLFIYTLNYPGGMFYCIEVIFTRFSVLMLYKIIDMEMEIAVVDFFRGVKC